VGSTKSAEKFHDQEPAVIQLARQQADQAKAPQAKPAQNGKSSTTAPATTTAPTGSTTINLNGTTTTVAAPATPDQAASNARENLADHLNKHTTLLVAGGLISTIGVLALVFGMIYTNLWSMRTGLLSRFWGMLGIAFGLFLVIPIFPPIPGLVLWFAAISLMFLGFWPRPLPPAWGAGEAIPWPRPGEDIGPPPEREPSGTVEGSGREISEPPLPEDGGPVEEQGMDQTPGETQGQRRKKRKRRK
jgi:hypothetical protein